MKNAANDDLELPGVDVGRNSSQDCKGTLQSDATYPTIRQRARPSVDGRLCGLPERMVGCCIRLKK